MSWISYGREASFVFFLELNNLNLNFIYYNALEFLIKYLFLFLLFTKFQANALYQQLLLPYGLYTSFQVSLLNGTAI